MKQLTKSDLIDIEALKTVLKMLSNDITEVKQSNISASEKANKIFQLYRDKGRLLNKATEKYPHVNWLNEAIGPDTSFNRCLKDTARIKAEQVAVFNHKNRLNLN